MRLTPEQIRLLQRYPRAASVWRRIGLTLEPTTRVVVEDGVVRLVRRVAVSQPQ